MAKKNRPKYPNKERIVRRRILSQALLLLVVAGGIGFYYYIQSDPELGTTLFRLGMSFGEGAKKAAAPAPEKPASPVVARQSIVHENPPAASRPSPSPAGAQSPSGPPDASKVKREIDHTTVPAPPPASHAAAAASATTRKRVQAAGPSYSAPVKHDTVTVYSRPEQGRPVDSPTRQQPGGTGSGSDALSTPDAASAQSEIADPSGSAPGGAPDASPPEAPSPPPEDQYQAEAPKEGGPGDMPFDGLGIEEVAKELAEKYRDEPSGKWGERVPGVTTRLELSEERSAPLVIALTFDACGGGKDGYDAELIAFLRKRKVPATLFVTSLWLRKNPDVLRELAADPLFEIAAHGERHRPCSVDGKKAYGIQGTASMLELVREVLANAREITALTGKTPLWFRSGTAYYDEVAAEVIQDLGLRIAGYSIAGDQGATLSASRVAAKILEARNRDIILLHMNKPRSGTREGVMRAIPVLQERGAVFVRLSEKY